MKAIRVEAFGGPEVLQLKSVPVPEVAAGQVRVRMQAAGVNPVETYIRSGHYARLPDLPYTPGTDGAGVVESLGAGVADLRLGERVYLAGSVTGTYAELAVANAASVWPLPDATSFAQGAALGVPCRTAYRALFQRAHAQAGEILLVHGATGSVGLAAVQLARAAGLCVLATSGTAAGHRLVSQQGADCVLDHHDAAHWQVVLEHTAGRGVDVIVEMLANVNLARDLQVLAPGGRVVVVGSRGAIEINPRDLMLREAAVLGVLLWNTTPVEARQIHAGLYAALRAGTLRPVVAEELSLADAPRAHERVLQAGALGKLALIP
ncbi:MAG TPA: NADPH:quinone reductase [Nevskiaceae bacterium]|nr:NADPH:quinone reductase [Nevskiaceae bacterium]